MKNIRSLCAMLVVLLVFLIILPSCDMNETDASYEDVGEHYDFNLLDAGLDKSVFDNEHQYDIGNNDPTEAPTEAPAEDYVIYEEGNYAEYEKFTENGNFFGYAEEDVEMGEETAYAGFCEETEVWIVEYEIGTDGESVIVFETFYGAEDVTEDISYIPPVQVECSFYSLYMYEYSEDIMRVIRSIRSGSESFISEAVKQYGGNGNYYAGLSKNYASIIAEGLLNTPLIMPRGDVDAEYFGITYYPKDDFLVISYLIDSVSYAFRYEAAEQRSDWHFDGCNSHNEILDGCEFKLFDSDKGQGAYVACLDYEGLSNGYVAMIIEGENPDFSQFEFVLMPE